MSRLDDIPTTAVAPTNARRSDVVARIRACRPSRRARLRGRVLAAAAGALVPLDRWLTRRGTPAAPIGRDDPAWPDVVTAEASADGTGYPAPLVAGCGWPARGGASSPPEGCGSR
jgi:hypothetical protein